jgi:hypothetical protein
MTDLRQAAQQALEALKSGMAFDKNAAVLQNLRTALEQPEPQAEPFSAVSIHATQTAWKMGYEAAKAEMQPEQQAESCVGKDPRCPCQDGGACHYKDCGSTKARPVAQRTWVGLETEEILDLFDVNNVYGSKWIEFARTVEAKLKAKNDY